MSSTTALSRARSTRQLMTKDESSQNKAAQKRMEARNVSPSRLPMKPLTKRTTFPAAIPSSTTTTTTTTRSRAPTSLTSRQASGNSSTRTTTRSTENGAPAAPKPLARAPTLRRAPSMRTTTTTTTTTATTTAPSPGIVRRSTVAARPTSSGEAPITAAPKERQLGHSRAKSTVTSLTAATTLRPVSNASSRTNPSPAPSSSSSTSTGTPAKPPSNASPSPRIQTRSQTWHTRATSQQQPPPQSQSQSSQPPTAASALAARRPAFNTNQQHYSPAKSHAPKPLTSTFFAPPSPSKQPVNVAITAETSRLQTELLQLSLLHRDAHSVTQSWHDSARSKLGARFEELAAADQVLREVEREGAEARGLQDLIRWANAGPQPSSYDGKKGHNRTRSAVLDQNIIPLDEKIRLLDQILNGAWALGEPGGRYQRAVRAFENWVHQVSEIRAAQRTGDIDGLLTRGGACSGFELEDDQEEGEIGFFVSDLDTSAWKRDHAGLVRVLEGWRRTLAQLGDVDPEADEDDDRGNKRVKKSSRSTTPPLEDLKEPKSQSGLSRTLRGCRSLVHGMLAELTMMEQIELDALAVEEEWMERMEAHMRAEEEAESRQKTRTDDVPPWKLLPS